jgi:putative peptidoglycan lipid II flippase
VSPGESKPGRSGAAGSSLVAAGILLSRLAGFARERVFGHYFGTSLYADVFRAGLRMPNVLQNLLGEGTLSASFIPVYSELLEEGREEEAGRVAGAIFALLLAAAGALSLFGILFAPLWVSVFLPGFEGERRELTIQVARIIFPMTGLLVLSAWALGILNSHRRFFTSYVAPVLWNGAMIGTLVLLGGGLSPDRLVIALAWGALLGGVLQLGIQLPSVLRLERQLKISWNTRLEGVRETLRNAAPAIMGRGVVQLSGYVDFILASLLAVGAVASIGYAQTLYILPVSLFGMSVAAAELPELARRRMGGDEELRIRTNAALQRIAFYVVPSFIVFVLLGDLAVAAIFQTGEFGADETFVVYLTLIGFSIGLVASTGTRLFSSTFFALRDTKTPAKIAVIRVVTAATLGFILMIQFEPVFGIEMGAFQGFNVAGQPLGAVGIAAGSGIAAWIEWGLLRRALRRRIGLVTADPAALAKMFAAALAAAGAGWLIRWAMPPIHPVVEAAAVFSTFGVVYFALTAILGVKEVQGLSTRLSAITSRFR